MIMPRGHFRYVKAFKTAFTDAFSSSGFEEYENKNHTGSESYIPSKNDVCVEDTIFFKCKSSSYGGAISCPSGTSVKRLFISDSSFTICKTTNDDGGGIYFYNENYGECAIRRICSFNCSSIYTGDMGTTGQCAFIHTKTDASYINHVNDSSITHTLIESKYPKLPLRLDNGNIVCPSVNMTNNDCYGLSCLACAPSIKSGSTEVTCSISYSSFVNNTANGDFGCICYNTLKSYGLISTCNIINNRQTSSDWAIIVTAGKLTIKGSCIVGNNMTFCKKNNNDITISNCTLDENGIGSSGYTDILTFIETIEYSFINALSHIVTDNCDSFFDSYGNLTSMYTISRKAKKKLSVTCIRKKQSVSLCNFFQCILLITK